MHASLQELLLACTITTSWRSSSERYVLLHVSLSRHRPIKTQEEEAKKVALTLLAHPCQPLFAKSAILRSRNSLRRKKRFFHTQKRSRILSWKRFSQWFGRQDSAVERSGVSFAAV